MASGVLDRRIRERRAARIERALIRDAPIMSGRRARVLAAVRVGAVPERDVDDVALLEGSMRWSTASARRPVPRAAAAPARVATDWGALLHEAREPVRVRARGLRDDDDGVDLHGRPVPGWATVLGGTGAALTLLALLRPLTDPAPWLAAGGLALALSAWLAARRP